MKHATHRLIAWAWNGLFLVLLLALVTGIAMFRLSPDTSTERNDIVTARASAADPVARIAASMIVPAGFMRAPSGDLLPRFASLARTEVKVRMGPDASYPVAWVVRGGRMPVEVVAESGDWLRIRDHEGEEGWVARKDVSDQRLAMVAPWRRNVRLALRTRPQAEAPLTAWLTPGVVVHVDRCDGHWCRIQVPRVHVTGWVGQEQLWGVYANETFVAGALQDAALETR